MKENKLHSIKNISGFLCLLFFLNLIYAIFYIILSKVDVGTDWLIQTASTLIMSFVLWRACSYIYSTLQYLFLTKEDKPAADLTAEEELLKNYSDHRS